MRIYGIGPKYINYEEGITYSTLAREAIKYKAIKQAAKIILNSHTLCCTNKSKRKTNSNRN